MGKKKSPPVFNSKYLRTSCWIFSAWRTTFQLRSYLNLTDAVRSLSFLKQPCRKTHPVAMERTVKNDWHASSKENKND